MQPVDFIKVLLMVFMALFPVVNPIGDAPIFLALTQWYPNSVRKVLARKIAAYGFALLGGLIPVWQHRSRLFRHQYGGDPDRRRLGGGRHGLEPAEPERRLHLRHTNKARGHARGRATTRLLSPDPADHCGSGMHFDRHYVGCAPAAPGWPGLGARVSLATSLQH